MGGVLFLWWTCGRSVVQLDPKSVENSAGPGADPGGFGLPGRGPSAVLRRPQVRHRARWHCVEVPEPTSAPQLESTSTPPQPTSPNLRPSADGTHALPGMSPTAPIHSAPIPAPPQVTRPIPVATHPMPYHVQPVVQQAHPLPPQDVPDAVWRAAAMSGVPATAARRPRWNGRKTAVVGAIALALTGAGAVAAAAATPTGISGPSDRGGPSRQLGQFPGGRQFGGGRGFGPGQGGAPPQFQQFQQGRPTRPAVPAGRLRPTAGHRHALTQPAGLRCWP